MEVKKLRLDMHGTEADGTERTIPVYGWEARLSDGTELTALEVVGHTAPTDREWAAQLADLARQVAAYKPPPPPLDRP